MVKRLKLVNQALVTERSTSLTTCCLRWEIVSKDCSQPNNRFSFFFLFLLFFGKKSSAHLLNNSCAVLLSAFQAYTHIGIRKPWNMKMELWKWSAKMECRIWKDYTIYIALYNTHKPQKQVTHELQSYMVIN